VGRLSRLEQWVRVLCFATFGIALAWPGLLGLILAVDLILVLLLALARSLFPAPRRSRAVEPDDAWLYDD
jgi:hypothetical protein